MCSSVELHAVLTAIAHIGTQNTIHSVIVTDADNRTSCQMSQQPPHDCKIYTWPELLPNDSIDAISDLQESLIPGAEKYEDTDMAALCFSSGTTGGSSKAVSIFQVLSNYSPARKKYSGIVIVHAGPADT